MKNKQAPKAALAQHNSIKERKKKNCQLKYFVHLFS